MNSNVREMNANITGLSALMREVKVGVTIIEEQSCRIRFSQGQNFHHVKIWHRNSI